MPPQHNRASLVQWYAQCYHDQLLKDMGESPCVKVRYGGGEKCMGPAGGPPRAVWCPTQCSHRRCRVHDHTYKM